MISLRSIASRGRCVPGHRIQRMSPSSFASHAQSQTVERLSRASELDPPWRSLYGDHPLGHRRLLRLAVVRRYHTAVPSIGFDFEDLALDIVGARDLSNWRYKDEDELDRLVQVGALTKSDVLWIREVAQAAARDIELRSSLFALGWETWRPPESWSIPVLPTDLDRPPAP